MEVNEVRKTKRSTAGNLPPRFREENNAIDDSNMKNPKSTTKNTPKAQSSIATSSPLAKSQQARPASRPRGRPRIRKPTEKAQEAHNNDDPDENIESNTMSAILPSAAFPTLDAPPPIRRLRDTSKRVGNTRRDSADVGDLPEHNSLLSSHKRQRDSEKTLAHETILPRIKRYLLDDRYIDPWGKTLHGVAAFYDSHADIYEAQKQDNRADSPSRDMAFAQFLETGEAELARQTQGRASLPAAFEHWLALGGANARSALSMAATNADRKASEFKDKV